MNLSGAALLGHPGAGGSDQNLLLGSVSGLISAGAVNVLLDGATTEVRGQVTGSLQGSVLVVGARVMGVRVGSTFYVTDLIGAASTGGGTLTFNGPWLGFAPGPTDGIAITLPGGIARVMCTVQAYSTTPGTAVPLRVDAYWDQVAKATMRAEAATVTQPAHTTLSTVSFSVAVAPGVHYLYFRQTSGNSDNNDYGSYMAVVTPA